MTLNLDHAIAAFVLYGAKVVLFRALLDRIQEQLMDGESLTISYLQTVLFAEYELERSLNLQKLSIVNKIINAENCFIYFFFSKIGCSVTSLLSEGLRTNWLQVRSTSLPASEFCKYSPALLHGEKRRVCTRLIL